MTHTKKKVSKIVDALVFYFLNLNATDIKLNIEKLDSQYSISISGNCKDVTAETVEWMTRLLNTPVHDEVEEYYWNLTGEGEINHGLALIGMMICNTKIEHTPGDLLKIKLLHVK